MDLPPGFRFHPTDEELITHYLYNKVSDEAFSALAIGDADLNKSEPWELPWQAKMGEKEWYFFCVKDRKYPSGLRTNRATVSGYWKATGKDKEIHKGKSLVGMKKTLVFYKGRAPKGLKTNWVMHEYRLEGTKTKFSTKNEWVITRVFEKSRGGKKIHISSSTVNSSYNLLPPLMDSSPPNKAYVPCFSNTNPQNDSIPSNLQFNIRHIEDVNASFMSNLSFDDQEGPSTSAGAMGIDCFMNYSIYGHQPE